MVIVGAAKMALLTKLSKLSIQTVAKRNVHVTTINAATKHKSPVYLSYWMPAPYPETEEERRKAAEKYGVHPSEYKPYPKGIYCLGDYPQLPVQRLDDRNPYYPWDLPQLRINYDEPVDAYYDVHSLTVDPYKVSPFQTVTELALILCGVVGTLFALMYITRDIKVFRPILKKQIPQEGVVHYTFEPAD